MHQLHDGVDYAGKEIDETGKEKKPTMSNQVQGTVDKVVACYEGKNKDTVILAAYLHKCLEVKRIDPKELIEVGKDENGKSIKVLPYTLSDIEKMFGSDVKDIVSDLSSEPTGDALDKKIAAFKQKNPNTSLSKKEIEWTVLADWATGLSKEAQAILLAEKWQNYIVSTKNPNEEKPIEWHERYVRTRWIMIETIRKASFDRMMKNEKSMTEDEKRKEKSLLRLCAGCEQAKENCLEALFYERDLQIHTDAQHFAAVIANVANGKKTKSVE